MSLKPDRGLPSAAPVLHREALVAVAEDRRNRRRPGDGSTGVRLLGYHRVSDDNDELAVSPARFSAQMEALADADVTVVGLEQAAELLNDGTHGRYACVTFDDGYRDNLEQAVPIWSASKCPRRSTSRPR